MLTATNIQKRTKEYYEIFATKVFYQSGSRPRPMKGDYVTPPQHSPGFA